MGEVTPAGNSSTEVTMLKLARELAADIRSLDEILEIYEVSAEQWRSISSNATFQMYLRRCIEEWNSASNTSERVRLKSMAFIEESLPEFYARAHDPKENLNHKVEVLKTVARFAGIGGSLDTGAVGERLSVTINLGNEQLRIERNSNPESGEIIEGDRL